jgi:autotransporter translocation and assembly factor TamB
VRAEIVVAAGSRLSGVALAGTARGTYTRGVLGDVAIDLSIGRSRLTATGGAGETGERLAVALDVPNLAELAPMFPGDWSALLSGALNARATLAGLPPGAASISTSRASA